MFTTFTGSSRRPRNINLSGRSSNPFSAAQQTSRGGQQTPHSRPGPSQNAVAQAQQERRARQAERERLQAVKNLQRVWRGYRARKIVRIELRKRWDDLALETTVDGLDSDMMVDKRHLDLEERFNSLQLLVRFVRWSSPEDFSRVDTFVIWFLQDLGSKGLKTLDNEWRFPLSKLAHWIVEAMETRPAGLNHARAVIWIRFVNNASGKFPDDIEHIARRYYKVMAVMIIQGKLLRNDQGRPLRFDELVKLFKPPEHKFHYQGFILGFLSTPDLDRHIKFPSLARHLNLGLLSKLARSLMSGPELLETFPETETLSMLAYFISLYQPSKAKASSPHINTDFAATIFKLLSRHSYVLKTRTNIHNSPRQSEVRQFILAQVQTLVNQNAIQALLAASELSPSDSELGPLFDNASNLASENASVLAGLALLLLRLFPTRGDDIRMWLYMGSMSKKQTGLPEPAIKFFWIAAFQTFIYQRVSEDPETATKCVRCSRDFQVADGLNPDQRDWEQLLLFLELYTFVLKVMDDEEFMTGAENLEPGQSWTRQSALPIPDVIHLTIFLKNLAFAMYWDPYEGEQESNADGSRLASYFGNSSDSSAMAGSDRSEEIQLKKRHNFAGINGLDYRYLKGMVTGLLRMLYERDSRRKFTPSKGHWLMKGFDMQGFIPAVVEEHVIKSQYQTEEDSEEEDSAADEESDDQAQVSLVGNSRTQNVLRIERLRKRQQREARRHHIQKVTPRLEILENMPFFIPFDTRVEIFREFVHNDQYIRREGYTDPDQWRMVMAHIPRQAGQPGRNLARHSARVSRERVFDDAYKAFYGLGEGLKEPIQITFVDQFNEVEAGIDGGGVTKEFLTSVTDEAFAMKEGIKLFVENDQHLMYPNPSAMDEQKELMRNSAMDAQKELEENPATDKKKELEKKAAKVEGSPRWNADLRDLLKRYEFLGRVVGKCLYEGILIDIHFAPFFLVKWALTGGTSSATNESGYRASINDLRELDESLYQGLLKLKNYSGNVEDFSFDFTITDQISREPVKFVDRDLRPRGSTIPVTNQNRLVYISSVARHRLQSQPAQQTRAFLRGIGAIIQPAWLSMFNQSELATLVAGEPADIDVDDLRAHTLYGGLYVIGDDGLEHPTVRDFWLTMKELSDKDRRRVLKYVTSTPRGPLLGFAGLNPRFSIRDSGNDETRLPSASTCVNLLKLPVYRNRRVLREKLLYAVRAGAGFNLS